MKKKNQLLNYALVALCTMGLMFPIFSFVLGENNTVTEDAPQRALADKTVSITFNELASTAPAVGKFEPTQQATTAINNFENIWNNAPSGSIQFDTSKITKSDLFTISAIDSLLQISNTSRYRATYLTIIKGVDPITGKLKSYLALVDKDMKLIKQSDTTTYIQEGGRCPEMCPE